MNVEEQIQKLLNPENITEEKYSHTLAYQQEILGFLICDRVFLTQSIGLVQPTYFVEQCHELICNIVLDHFQRYKHLPTKMVIEDEIKQRRGEDSKLWYYLAELDAVINSYVPGLNSREEALDKITVFAKAMAIRGAISKSLSELKKNDDGKWGKIRGYFEKALAVDRNFDIGLDYFQTLEDRYERMKNQDANREVFVTGFRTIDEALGGGLGRGEIGAFAGLSGAGKSLCLTKVAVHNVVLDKKVLYVSLEMDQDKIARRFDAQLSEVPIGELKYSCDRAIRAIKENVVAYDDKRRLLIKQFPAGTANVDTIRAFMAQLQLLGFVPDLLVLDYVGEMKDFEPPMKTYESRQRLVRDLRGFGVERQHCTFTAMQINRMGREQQEEGVIDDNALGDSSGQARPLDGLWSINQRPDEKKMNIGRIFTVKLRDGPSRTVFPFEQDPKSLRMNEISEARYHEKKMQYTQLKSDETDKVIKEKVIK